MKKGVSIAVFVNCGDVIEYEVVRRRRVFGFIKIERGVVVSMKIEEDVGRMVKKMRRMRDMINGYIEKGYDGEVYGEVKGYDVDVIEMEVCEELYMVGADRYEEEVMKKHGVSKGFSLKRKNFDKAVLMFDSLKVYYDMVRMDSMSRDTYPANWDEEDLSLSIMYMGVNEEKELGKKHYQRL